MSELSEASFVTQYWNWFGFIHGPETHTDAKLRYDFFVGELNYYSPLRRMFLGLKNVRQRQTTEATPRKLPGYYTRKTPLAKCNYYI